MSLLSSLQLHIDRERYITLAEGYLLPLYETYNNFSAPHFTLEALYNLWATP